MPVAIFDIPQVVNLVWPESVGAGPRLRMNYPVNRTDFTLLRDVRNDVEFFLRDIDRQPVSVELTTFEIILTDQQATRTLLRRALTVTEEARALLRLTVQPEDMLEWPAGFLRWSVVATRDGETNPVMMWTDRDYTPYGFCRLLDGPVPDPIPPITINPDDMFPSDAWLVTSALRAAANFGFPDGVQSFSVDVDEFTGEIIAEGSLQDQPSQSADDWFEAERLVSDVPTTGTLGLTVDGNVLWVRLRIKTISGSATTVLYRV